jgi:thiol-disulfide isomerase/thioredoxin
MQGERLLARLVEHDVVDDSGDVPVLSESFRERVDAYETDLALQDDGAELAQAVRDEASELQVPNRGSTFDAEDVPYLAELLALTDRLADAETALQVFPTLDLFTEDPPPVDGTPEFFVQVTGSRLRTLVKVYERTVIYAWGHDCPPCETVREDLEDFLDEPMEGIPMLAVCGEGCAELLYEAFDLKGAPTLLFTIDGRVDLRLEGAHHKDVLEAELDRFPSLPAPETLQDYEERDPSDGGTDAVDQET